MGAVVTHSQKSKDWEKVIDEAIGEVTKLVGAVSVELWCFLPRPASVDRFYPAVYPDIDKLARAVLDGMKRIYEDDSRVVDLVTHKRYATEDFSPGILVYIQEKVDDVYELAMLKEFQGQWGKDRVGS